MDDKKMTTHEILQLHEILTLKNVDITKSVTMLPLISDNKLKDLVQQHINSNEEKARELKKIIEKDHYELMN
jgi:similar to spore coat protein